MESVQKVFFVVEYVGKTPAIIERTVIRKQGNFYLLNGRATTSTNHIACQECRDTAEEAILLFMRRKYNELMDMKKEIERFEKKYDELKVWAKNNKKK